MHVVWVNEKAALVGGAERYIFETVALLAERGVRSTLLHGAGVPADPDFTGRFEAAFPLADPSRQLERLGTDVVYLHQLDGAAAIIDATVGARVPAVRFIHDHALFCPREHKYTTLGRQTCTRPVGAHCYPCLGVLRRTARWPGVRLRTASMVRAEQRRHDALDAMVVSSAYMRRHVLAHGFRPEQVHRIPLFVRPPDAPPEAAREEAQLLFVGALLRGKGLDILIEALRFLPEETTLSVVGEGPQRPLFEALAQRRRLSHRVRFEGRLRGEDLTRAYATTTCLVVPSRSPETFSLVGPEALLLGTPVIASDVGGVREWLEPGVTGLAVPSCDPEALSEAALRILREPELGRRLGGQGRERCLELLTPDRHAEALLALLSSVGRT